MAGAADEAFAGYRFHRVLGPGSESGVYDATEQDGGRPVVIETLVGEAPEDEHLRDWFREAWEEIAGLEHAGVVRVFEVGDREGVPFTVREKIEGEDLAASLERGDGPSPEAADDLFESLVGSLGSLHEAGVIHGGLDESCVLIGTRADEEDAAPDAYLTGFGRVEGHRGDDVRGLARIYGAMLGDDAPDAVTDAIGRAEGGDYRSVPELAAALREARGGDETAAVPAGDEHERDEAGATEDADEEPDGRSPHRRARAAFLAAVAVGVAAVVAVVVITSGEKSEPSPEPMAADTAPEDPPPPPDVSATGEGSPPPAEEPEPEPAGLEPISVDGGPAGVAVRDGVVYTVTESGELVGYDERTGKEEVGPIELGAGAREVTIVDDVAWATLPRDNGLARVDLAAGGESSTITVGEGPTGVIGAFGSIFVAESGSGGLSEVDPAGETVTPLIIGAQDPQGVTFGDGVLWVADGAGFVQRVDPDNPASSESFGVGAEPRGILVVDGEVWVANSGDGTVSRLDERTGEGKPVDVGGEPLDLASDGERVYVANGEGYVSAIDIASGTVERTEVPEELGSPVAVAAGDEVWVTTEGGSLVPLG